MTTQINVIVDNGGLSAKAKQQTNANRWAKLEKDGKELVANRASDERENALARVGLDPKGNPLYGTSPQLQVRKDEPAATRLTRTFRVGHGWLVYIGEEDYTSEAYKRKYRVYSGDLSTYLEFSVERAKPPEPAFKWGLQSYNVTRDFDFTNAEWQSGYQVSPSDPLVIQGFGYLKNKDSLHPIKRAHFMGLERVVSHLRNYSTSPVSRTVSYDPLIEQNAAWWASGPQIQGITDRYTTRIRRKSITDYRQLALPVGGDTMLVVISYNSYESAHYYGQRISKLCGASGDNLTFVKDHGDWFRTNEDLYDPDEPIFGGAVVFWYGTYRYGGYRESDVLADSFDDTYTNERLVTKCFLVSSSEVKEVAVPAAFAEALGKRYPFTQDFPSYPKTLAGLSELQRLLYLRQSTLDQQWIDQYWVPEEQAYSYWPQMDDIIAYTQSSSYSSAVLTYNFNAYTPPSPPTNQLQNPDYGFDYLDPSRPSFIPVLSDNYTPGVFTLLGIENSISPSVTLDVSYSTIGTESDTTWILDYRYALGLPENLPSGDIRLLKNSAPPLRITSAALAALPATGGSPTLFRAWNWGKPAYCLDTLSSLGFSEADLTP